MRKPAIPSYTYESPARYARRAAQWRHRYATDPAFRAQVLATQRERRARRDAEPPGSENSPGA